MSAEKPPAFPAAAGFDAHLLRKFVSRVGGGEWRSDQCWPWEGYVGPQGYGVFAPSKTVQYRAHRFALKAHLGRDVEGLVLHSCDNRRCVNPSHLREGSHLDNMADMVERSRAAHGIRHPKAKLTPTKVIAMVVMHRGGDFSTQELATMFGMSQPTVAAITAGKLWQAEVALADALLATRTKEDSAS